MTQETGNVAEEIQSEGTVQPQESQSRAESDGQERSDKEINFQNLRLAKQQLEKENRELKAWKESQTQKQNIPDKEEDYGIDDDDLVEGKVVKQIYRDLNTLKRNYENDKLATIPDRLRGKFSDFDQVVTPENVELLKQSEPELYMSITAGQDLYAKGVSAYKTLKSMGIVKEDHYKSEKEKVQQNHSKPMSIQAIRGQGALSDANAFANGLTPELKKQLQQEMYEAVKAR
jgi:hypothetical protein